MHVPLLHNLSGSATSPFISDEGGNVMPYEDPISVMELQEKLAYNPETGIFVWKVKPARNIPAWSEAGATKTTRHGNDGAPVQYRYIRLRGVSMTAARVAWALTHGEWPEGKLYQRDGNPLNLKLDNLEISNSVSESYDHGDPDERAAYRRAHREKFPRVWKERHLQKGFGIGMPEYIEMAIAQGNKCAICDQPETEMRDGKLKTLAVDHNHTTGEVRALLCTACNKAIGLMCESPDALRAAADYLEKHASTPMKGA